MRGRWVTIAVIAAVIAALPTPVAAAKPSDGDDSVVRKYRVTYSGTAHREDTFPADGGTASYVEDLSWNLRSKDAPIKMVTSRRHNFGSVTGGVITGEMIGSATRTTTITEPGFPTSTSTVDGPDVVDASLDHDEGTNKQHALGATGLDYGTFGTRELYPMPIDGRHPRKGFALKIEGQRMESTPDGSVRAQIDATWTLELASKKPKLD